MKCDSGLCPIVFETPSGGVYLSTTEREREICYLPAQLWNAFVGDVIRGTYDDENIAKTEGAIYAWICESVAFIPSIGLFDAVTIKGLHTEHVMIAQDSRGYANTIIMNKNEWNQLVKLVKEKREVNG